MESCVGGRFESCETARYGDYGQRIDYCQGTVFEGSVVTGPRSGDEGRREAIHVAHSTGTTIDRPRVRACRLGIGLSNGCFGVTIDEPSISGAAVHAIATHDGATTAGGIRIEGGTVGVEADDGGSDPEGCLSFSNACEGATVRGTTIHPARTAISSDAWRLDVADVVVESAEDEPGGIDERGRCGNVTPVVKGATVDSI